MELCWKKEGREGREGRFKPGGCWPSTKVSKVCGITHPRRHPHVPTTLGAPSQTSPSLYFLKGQSPWLVAKK